MRIQSIRLGHANNSSSTHSILLNATGTPVASGSGDFQYGWDWFHLVTKNDKSKYLAALVYSALARDMSDEHAQIIAKELTGADIVGHLAGKGEDSMGAYVDHQSVPIFPIEYGSNAFDDKGKIDAQFMREFVEYVRNNSKVTIGGGNDNTESWERNLFGGTPIFGELPRDGRELLISRKDGDWWILYNKGSGAKIRISFKDDAKPFAASSTPELVDVKITDYCPMGCKFCHQSSTRDGKHADLKKIERLAYDLNRAKVFEVALGGGETTTHPDFPSILKIFNDHAITPNFTTFNMNWRKNEKIADAVKKYCRSFAVSYPNDVRGIALWNDDLDNRNAPRGVLQIPLGCYDEATTKRALKDAINYGVNVTFLGYKHYGRGERFQGHDYGWVVDWIMEQGKERRFLRFGADSLFVQQFGEVFKTHGVSELLMVNAEGAYSCYIDAVEGKMGASSYTKELHELPQNDVFKNFPYAGKPQEETAV